MDRNKKQKTKTGTAEIKFLRNVAGCRSKDQITNTKIMEELNILI
jgi:hypothetical protein